MEKTDNLESLISEINHCEDELSNLQATAKPKLIKAIGEICDDRVAVDEDRQIGKVSFDDGWEEPLNGELHQVGSRDVYLVIHGSYERKDLIDIEYSSLVTIYETLRDKGEKMIWKPDIDEVYEEE